MRRPSRRRPPPRQPFGLTVTVDDPSGQVDSNYNGTVTLTLLPNLSYLATLGGTLTVMAQNGVANFTGLTLDQTGTGFQIVATTDDQTSTATTPIAIVQSTPVAVAKPTTIVAEQVLYAGKGRHRHVDGFELVISSALDSTRAVDIADYTLTQTMKRGHKPIAKPVPFRVAYDASSDSVTLMLIGKPKFAHGGELVVNAQSPGGLTDTAGQYLDGGNQARPDNGVFLIAEGDQHLALSGAGPGRGRIATAGTPTLDRGGRPSYTCRRTGPTGRRGRGGA